MRSAEHEPEPPAAERPNIACQSKLGVLERSFLPMVGDGMEVVAGMAMVTLLPWRLWSYGCARCVSIGAIARCLFSLVAL
jgi:hypothetical protein